MHPDNLILQFHLLNQALVNSHLEGIPGLGSFSARGLSGGDLKSLGGETDGALDAEVLGLGALDKFLADFLEGCDFSTSEGYPDAMDFLREELC